MSDTETAEGSKRVTRMRYVALKRMKVGNGYREPGEDVPEAASWRNLQAYLNRFMLQAVPISQEGVEGGVDLSQQAGRTESDRPVHKPEHATEGDDAGQPKVSSAATDFDRMTAQQIQDGLAEGSLQHSEVEAYEMEREKGPRKGVLRELGWSEEEIEQGYRHEDTPFEPEALPEDEPYDQWTDEQLLQGWHDRYGESQAPPDDREGLIEDLEAPPEEDDKAKDDGS